MPRHAKKKSRLAPVLLLTIIAVIVLAVLLYPRPTSQIERAFPAPVTVDVISTLQYGPVTLTGRLAKDTPTGDRGTYVLVVDSGNFVELAVEDIDGLLSNELTVTGELTPPTTNGGHPILVPSTITTTGN